MTLTEAIDNAHKALLEANRMAVADLQCPLAVHAHLLCCLGGLRLAYEELTKEAKED